MDIEAYESYGCASIAIEAIIERFETDLEVVKRIYEEKEKAKIGKQNALSQIERLKREHNL